jgi:spore germination protein GerM
LKNHFNILLYSIIIISSLLLTSCTKKDTVSITNSEKEKKIAFSKDIDNNNLLDLKIYFDSSSKLNNVKVSQEKRVIKKDELLAETIMNELIKGPSVKGQLSPILPNDTRLLTLSIKDNIAYINLSKEANIPMTFSKEKTCIKSIVLSLTQVSTINKVKISIENTDINIFGNNFDLSKPVGKEDVENIKQN